MLTISHNNQVFKAKIKETDNYQYSVNVFKEGEKMPIFGTRFSVKASISQDIIPFIQNGIAEYQDKNPQILPKH